MVMESIDESLYSRQLYVFGEDAMRKMIKSNILICRIGGLGVEIAKNIILAGVKSVVLHDDKVADWMDLSSQYYLTEDDVLNNRNRAMASLSKLQELNEYVPVSILDSSFPSFQDEKSEIHIKQDSIKIDEEKNDKNQSQTQSQNQFLQSILKVIQDFNVIICTEMSLDDQIVIDEECRQHGVFFISSRTIGLFASIFCDFGPKFIVHDQTGEPLLSGMISNICREERRSKENEKKIINKKQSSQDQDQTQDQQQEQTKETESESKVENNFPDKDQDYGGSDSVVTCVDESRHGLEDGDIVIFREVKGLQINNVKFKVRVLGPFTFSIGNIDSFDGEYSGGGIFDQVRQSKELSFKSLKETIESGKIENLAVISDFAKIDRIPLLHAMFQAFDSFKNLYNHHHTTSTIPIDLEKMVKLVQKFIDPMESLSLSLNSNSNNLSCNSNSNNPSPSPLQDKEIKIIKAFINGLDGNLAPMTAFIGGLVAQEALKACTGKFHPIHQYFYFDALECLGKEDACEDADEKKIDQSDQSLNLNCKEAKNLNLNSNCKEAKNLNLNSNSINISNSNSNEISSSNNKIQIDLRYSGQAKVIGSDIQEKLHKITCFIVGAGAIGCELLKIFAMMGIGTHSMIHLTDMDNIERSNLNRQFLFRTWNVNTSKSLVASQAIKSINPQMKIMDRMERVGPESEHVFNSDFFNSLDVIINALDNVEARRYVDRQCVYYRKPLLESGTLGTKGNTQVIIPDLTESYSSSQDPPEKSIPFCTLHNFPNSIEHTIEWAVDQFHGSFKADPENVNSYLEKPEEFIKATMGSSMSKKGISNNTNTNTSNSNSNSANTNISSAGASRVHGQKERIESLLKNLIFNRPTTFEECVCWARMRFQELFHNQIAQLLFNFPKDSITNSGAFFWSGPKRAPSPIIFDCENSLHLMFVMAASNLRASVYGIQGSRDLNLIASMAALVKVAEFKPRSGVKIQVSEDGSFTQSNNSITETDVNGHDENSSSSIAAMNGEFMVLDESSLPDPSHYSGFRLNPIEFEKDNDANLHVDLIASMANLRAINYEITPAEKSKIKQVAGKIIPAIATTTAAVAGLISLELLKLISCSNSNCNIEMFKNGFVNLALPFFGFSEPIKAKKQKYLDKEWTIWNRFEIERNLTLGELISWFKSNHHLVVTMISHGSTMLYGFFSAFSKKDSTQDRMVMTISTLVEHVSKKPIPSHCKYLVLELLAEDEEGNDVDVPYVNVKIK